jgi:hypothetical protein
MSLPLRLVGEIHALHSVTIDPDLIQSRIEEALSKLESFDVNDLDPDESALADDDEGDGSEVD